MFEKLKAYHSIVVSGPQRSGTRICAQCIAHDTGYEYIDEKLLGPGACYAERVQHYVGQRDKVLHCPAFSHRLTELPEGVLVVFMVRPLSEIVVSQNRIKWRCSETEADKYDKAFNLPKCVVGGPVALRKYWAWQYLQKPVIKNWREVRHESLKDHPLWVQTRTNWKWDQTQ